MKINARHWRISAAVLIAVTVLAMAGHAAVGIFFHSPVQADRSGIVSDFGRDIVGARAALEGENPYQRLGALDPARFSGTPAAEWWVAHPPAALTTASLANAMLGADQAETIHRWVIALSAIALAALLAGDLWPKSRLLAISLAFTVVFWIPLISDIGANQGAAPAGLAVYIVLKLDRSGRHGYALALLGVLAAWKMWPIVLALAMPASKSWLRDAVATSAAAAVTTLLALPWAGGFSGLWRWMTEALPRNTSEVPSGGVVDSWLTITVLLLAFVAFMSSRERYPRASWPFIVAAAYVGLAPISWVHYLAVVVPALLWPLLSGVRHRSVLIGVTTTLALGTVLTIMMNKPWLPPTVVELAARLLMPTPLVAALAFTVHRYVQSSRELEAPLAASRTA